MPTIEFTGAVYCVGETLGRSHETVTTDTLIASPSSPGGFAVTPVTANVSRQIGAIWQIGYNIKWYFQGMGTVDAANTYNAKILARQAQLQQQKEAQSSNI